MGARPGSSLLNLLQVRNLVAVVLVNQHLTQIALHFNISIATGSRKEAIKQAVFSLLVEKQILAGESEVKEGDEFEKRSEESDEVKLKELDVKLKLELEHMKLQQTIRLRELDEYFTLFERVAEMARGVQAIVASDCVGWESSKCVCIFICCSNYKTVKEAILRAYELVPEAYRQQFGKLRKSESQTHVEFAREQQILFECWCKSQDIVYCFYIKCIQEVHYINSSMQPSLKPSQYSNDAVEIKVRKNDM